MPEHSIDKLAECYRDIDLQSIRRKKAFNITMLVLSLLGIITCSALLYFGYYSNKHEQRLIVFILGCSATLIMAAMLAQWTLITNLSAGTELVKLRDEQWARDPQKQTDEEID